MHTETSLVMKTTFHEMDDVNRERHDEILDKAQLSEKEREVRIAGSLKYSGC